MCTHTQTQIHPPTHFPIPTHAHRDQLGAFTSDDEAIQTLTKLVADIKVTTAWHLQFELLTTVRRLVTHHPDVLAEETATTEITPFVAELCKSPRSSVARNAIMAMDDFTSTCSTKVTEQSSLIANTLMKTSASNQPKIIRATTSKALDSACMAGPLCISLAPSLAANITDKNRDVQKECMKFTNRCVQNMTKEQIQSQLDFKALLPNLYTGMNDTKSPEAKKDAKAACMTLAKAVGDEEWAARCKLHMLAQHVSSMVAAATAKKAGAEKRKARKKFVPPPRPTTKVSDGPAIPEPLAAAAPTEANTVAADKATAKNPAADKAATEATAAKKKADAEAQAAADAAAKEKAETEVAEAKAAADKAAAEKAEAETKAAAEKAEGEKKAKAEKQQPGKLKAKVEKAKVEKKDKAEKQEAGKAKRSSLNFFKRMESGEMAQAAKTKKGALSIFKSKEKKRAEQLEQEKARLNQLLAEAQAAADKEALATKKTEEEGAASTGTTQGSKAAEAEETGSTETDAVAAAYSSYFSKPDNQGGLRVCVCVRAHAYSASIMQMGKTRTHVHARARTDRRKRLLTHTVDVAM